jgi:hypothetical protein
MPTKSTFLTCFLFRHNITEHNVESEALAAISVKISLLGCDIMQRGRQVAMFRGTCCFQLQGRRVSHMEANVMDTGTAEM